MSALLCVLLLQATPAAAWEERTPEAAGLSPAKLQELRDLAGGRGCVVRGGRLVAAWGDLAKSGDVGAAALPVLSTLLMVAVHEGKLSGVDARVSEVQPRLTGKDAGITWRHLASRLSGYGLAEGPGEAWSANDDSVALFADTLMDRIYRQPANEVMESRLGRLLGFQDPYGFEPGQRLSISPRDFARLGLLILRGGAWGPKEILAPSLTYLSISAPVPSETPGAGKSIPAAGPGCSSFSWWLNGIDARRQLLFVDGPPDLIAALGQGGRQALWILPSRDLVVAWSDARIDDLDRSPGNPEARINRAVGLMAGSLLP